jgi:hypothetical protein
MKDLYRITESVSQTHVKYHTMIIPQGKEAELADLNGPGKVAYLYITDNPTDGSVSDFYLGLVLKVYWDGSARPSINVPLSDFFGAMAGCTIDYQSAPMQVQHKCFMCHLPMPFSLRARFVLANDGDKDYSGHMAYGIDYELGRQYGGEKSRLHCAWRRSNPVRGDAPPLRLRADQTGGKTDINSRHTILDATGRGQYVGNFLQVHTQSSGWWGEGITIFHVDGKTMIHTPGTEDEYGSCWGFGGTFAYPYCGYLQNEKGDHRMYRWYVANPVRFQKSLKVEIQDIRNFGPGSDDFTSVAYWYQDEPYQEPPLQSFAERTAPSKASVETK